jgi:hypothetical protein
MSMTLRTFLRSILLGSFSATVLAGEGSEVLSYKLPNGTPRRIRTAREWAKRRHEILESMQLVMGRLPGREKRCPFELKTLTEEDMGNYVRRFIEYSSEPGSRVPAYLLIPKACLQSKTRRSAVLCLHQTHKAGQKVVVGLGNSPDDEYGVELVERGFVCLAPAYPLLANYAPDLQKLGYESGTMKAIWDNRRGLDLLETFPYVRRGKFATIGHSLGGHNSLFTAAFDPRLKFAATSCGFDSFRDYMKGDIRGWTSTRYMPHLAKYKLPELPFDFPDVLGAIAPRACFISAPLGDTNFQWRSVDSVVARVRPIYRLLGAPNQPEVHHPDCGHRFPPELRQLAYERIAKVLG